MQQICITAYFHKLYSFLGYLPMQTPKSHSMYLCNDQPGITTNRLSSKTQYCFGLSIISGMFTCFHYRQPIRPWQVCKSDFNLWTNCAAVCKPPISWRPARGFYKSVIIYPRQSWLICWFHTKLHIITK